MPELTKTAITEKLTAANSAVKSKEKMLEVRAKIQSLVSDVNRIYTEIASFDTKSIDADIEKPLKAAILVIQTAKTALEAEDIKEYLGWRPE